MTLEFKTVREQHDAIMRTPTRSGCSRAITYVQSSASIASNSYLSLATHRRSLPYRTTLYLVIQTCSYGESKKQCSGTGDVPSRRRCVGKTEPPEISLIMVHHLSEVYAKLSLRAGAYPKEVVRLTVCCVAGMAVQTHSVFCIVAEMKTLTCAECLSCCEIHQAPSGTAVQ